MLTCARGDDDDYNDDDDDDDDDEKHNLNIPYAHMCT
jgi:hypothetical protein